MASKQFTASIFAWLHQINRGRYLAIDVKVALALTQHFNEADQGGRAFPSYKTIGGAIGMSEHSVIRSVERLRKGGELRVIPGRPGRGHPNQYWMIVKPAPAQVFETGKPATAPAGKPANAPPKTCTAAQENQRNQIPEGERLGAPPSGGRESAPAAREDQSLERGGRLDGAARSRD
jgi:hypothetical protein